MADIKRVATNGISSEPSNLDVTVANDEFRTPTGSNDNSKGHHGDSIVMNMGLLKEINILQQRLLELEKEARPTLVKNTLEAEWERVREELGPEEERKVWREEE